MLELGDIQSGRVNLGLDMPVFVYRLLEMSIIEVLKEEFGKNECDRLIKKAGYLAGQSFAKKFVKPEMNFNEFVALLQNKLREYKIGILRVEQADMDKGEIILSIYEDLDCSGLPVTYETTCVYDEGFLSAILESYAGYAFHVKEIDCWSTGERVCRFKALSDIV